MHTLQNDPAAASQTNATALAAHLRLTLIAALGPQAWLARTAAGQQVVLKTGAGAAAAVHDLLLKVAALQPPFASPRGIVGQPDLYLLYHYLPGTPLSTAAFDTDEVLQAVFELSGRLTALFRSLKLAPLVAGLTGHASGIDPGHHASARRLAALGASLGERQDGLAVRRWEASQSYAWAQEIVSWCRANWPAGDHEPAPPWAGLRQRVADVTSIHLTVHGSSLAHTAFTPEHILSTAPGHWAILSWQVAPRPYNYMRYRYLAWCLVHTPQGDIATRYRRFLSQIPAINAAAAHPLTFALALLQTWVEARGAVSHRQEKWQVIQAFVAEAITPEYGGVDRTRCTMSRGCMVPVRTGFGCKARPSSAPDLECC